MFTFGCPNLKKKKKKGVCFFLFFYWSFIQKDVFTILWSVCVAYSLRVGIGIHPLGTGGWKGNDKYFVYCWVTNDTKITSHYPHLTKLSSTFALKTGYNHPIVNKYRPMSNELNRFWRILARLKEKIGKIEKKSWKFKKQMMNNSEI